MKKILIISPHFPPSNLTAVHRARFLVNHLPALGWDPTVLTVHEKFYEEALDDNLEKLLPLEVKIEKVNAWKVGKPRLIGDIGLRGFSSMYWRAKELIQREKFDFLYIIIPSFYGALWGRMLHRSTGVKYGIDYIDPWVHEFPGSEKLFSRHWFSTMISKILEPIAVKHVSVITGVAESYYIDVLKRNPHLKERAICEGIPFGSEDSDHLAVDDLGLSPYLFKPKDGRVQMVYAGAMLPKAYLPLEKIFQVIKENPLLFVDVEFHFIGSGKTPNDAVGYNIKPLAEKYGLWESVVFEYPKRIPYLDVLVHLHAATGIFILGSTEPHYTPSKVYQGVLSAKPILAVLHEESTAVKVIRDSKSGIVLSFNGEGGVEKIGREFTACWKEYRELIPGFTGEQVDRSFFELYSARHISMKLVALLNKVVA